MSILICKHTMRVFSIIFTFLLVLIAGNSYSQDAITQTKESFSVEIFLGQCLNNMPRIDKVESAAKVFNWTKLNKDQAVMVAPADPDVKFDGWYVRGGVVSYMIGTSLGEWNESDAPTCTVAFSEVSPNKVKSLLVSILKSLKVVDQQVSGGQRIIVWKYLEGTSQGYITLTDASPMDVDAFSLSVISPIKKNRNK
jgi:hypothetical protein